MRPLASSFAPHAGALARRLRRAPRAAALALAALGLASLTGLQACGERTEPPPAPVAAPAPAPAGTGALERRRPDAPVRRDLAADEAQGGHTLERHVGRSDADLRERLRRERRISAASTWTDRATAEEVVAAALARERQRVERWAARTGPRSNLALDWEGDGGRVLGRSLRRGARAPVPCFDAVVVLRWNGDGWYVLTSYPEARR